MLDIVISDRAKAAHPQLRIGVLVLSNVTNRFQNASLHARRLQLQDRLAAAYGPISRKELSGLPILRDYCAYYKRFGKTYHVLLQLESILRKQRDIPEISPLVQAMFMAELETWLLTAGHDCEKISAPIAVDSASGLETYETMSGETKTLQKDDLHIRTTDSIISSIVYGPDRATQITEASKTALYTCYVPFQLETAVVRSHLERIAEYIESAQEGSSIEDLRILE